MYMFDIETLGIESTTVILSAAITHFDFDQVIPEKDRTVAGLKKAYQFYLDESCYVKFNAKEQIEQHKRSITKGTLDWWKKQAEIPRAKALNPSDIDVSALDGINKMKAYIEHFGGNNQICWARGTLDQMAIDSLCRALDVEPLFRYNMWRDMRTAIDLLATDASNGYVKIPDFNDELIVTKHDPVHDCAFDIMMLLYHV